MANTPPTSKGVLVTTRIVWLALILGQVLFLLVILMLRRSSTSPPSPALPLGYIAMAMAVGTVPVAYLLRKTAYGQPDEQGHIAPGKYVSGNILFLGMLEGVSLFGLVCFLLGDSVGVAVFAAMMAVQVLNFPTGSAMAPH